MNEQQIRSNPLISSLIAMVKEISPDDVDKASKVNLDLIRFMLENYPEMTMMGKDLAQNFVKYRGQATVENILNALENEHPALAIKIKSNPRNLEWFSNQIYRMNLWIFEF